MSEKQVIVKSSFPFIPILGLLFITLKLTGYIQWPWLWVLSPFWVPFAIALAVFIMVIAVAGVMYAVAAGLEAMER